jgi:signal transduction histidine kinase/DNA-binding response OmpR family regulator
MPYKPKFYFDKKNRTWVYTAFGVYLIELKKNQFSFFENIEYGDSWVPPVRGIIANSTEMTVVFRDKDVGKYDFKSKQWSYIRTYSDYLHAIYASEDGLWISGGNIISLWKNGELATYPIFVYEDGVKRYHSPWCIFPSNLAENKLWLGTEHGFLLFDTESKKSQSMINPLIKGEYHVQTIVRDKQHKNWLWLCSNKGLILFDEAKKEFLNLYSFNQSKKQFLPTDDVQHLYQDEEGIYWLATVDGVIRWNKAKNEYRQLTVADGLPDNVVYAMYPDDYGNLWMSSDYGIIQMNKTTFAIRNYLPEDGIGQKEFNRISHFSYRDENGVQRLLFGGLGGVTAFYPKDFQKNNQEIKPRLAILKYRQFDGSQKSIVDYTATLMATKKIVIQPSDYIHSLEVGLLNYDNVDNNQYRYQIEVNGKSSDWITQQSRFIQVGQLPFGTHQLIITGNTQNNISAKNDLTIDIIIRRPFYLTWWFVLIAIATIVGSIFYYFNNKNSRLKAKQIELEGLVKERTEKIETDKAIIEQQAEELKKIDATKSRFFANISHELRTPITLIQGPIQSALNSQGLNNRNFTLLTKAKQNTEKLVELVNEILDLTKLDAHKLVLAETTVVFYLFLRSIISSFESIAAIQGTDLLFIYDIPKSLQIKVDKSKLEKVLNNLLSNAFKFTPKNGKIIVHIQDLGNVIQMTVKDNGRGVPTEDVPNIFNRFYQSSINKKAEGGLGIGLALSMEFVKLMKGKMWVESQIGEVETGSTFFVQFPKKEVIKMITTEEQEMINHENEVDIIPILLNENIPNNADLETILIVEDNYDLRDYLSYTLSPHYNIITAENGQEGLEKLQITNHRDFGAGCQLILSDVMMPVMDGFEFLEKVKANDKWRGLPFIMLTARAEMQTRLNALRIGVDDYLLKPFDEEELLVRVKNLIANYKERIATTRILSEDTVEQPKEIMVLKADQEWLAALEQLIFAEIDNSIFSVDFLAEALSINRKTLYNKIKELTGLTPTKYRLYNRA